MVVAAVHMVTAQQYTVYLVQWSPWYVVVAIMVTGAGQHAARHTARRTVAPPVVAAWFCMQHCAAMCIAAQENLTARLSLFRHAQSRARITGDVKQ